MIVLPLVWVWNSLSVQDAEENIAPQRVEVNRRLQKTAGGA